MSIERRYLQELRASNDGDQFILEGYAARFNQPSKDLGGFVETIAPGAFKRALSAPDADVRCLFNHNPDKVLGRTAAKTLSVNEDGDGLHFRCQLDPNQQAHRDLHSSVKRGDIGECSFAFTPNGAAGDQWENRQDAAGNWFIQRTLKDVNLFDVSAVTHPAYDGTNVAARSVEYLTVEVRSHISELTQKRALMLGKVEKRDQSVQDMLSCISKCLSEQYPCEPADNGCCSSYGMYWICDTYDDYVVASKEGGPGPSEYFKISYTKKPDGEGYVFGTPTPVEKEYVPSERAKSIAGEQRAMTAAHKQMVADQHAQAAAAHDAASKEAAALAAAHADHAQVHQEAADAAQTDADKMARCEACSGDCAVKGCRCQNVMVAARDLDDDYENWEGEWGDDDDDDDEPHKQERSARKSAEVRGGPGSGRQPEGGSGETAKTNAEHLAAAKEHTEKAMHDTKPTTEKTIAHGNAAIAHLTAVESGKKEDADAANEYSKKANALRSEIDSAEVRADGSDKVRTKTVAGKQLTQGAFAFVGDPKDTSTWKLPVHDKSHADNAAARLNQTNDIPADKKPAVEAKIKAAQKKYGESPDDNRAFNEEMELRFRLAMLATEL